ncbi:MAG: enoyl-CoA hydratase [Thermoleophilaceae bacterium]|nr:enoyl-CoA hydratase [Thermoleophilaceae bacterium]
MTDEQLVLRDDNDGVATLTLNRPDKLNALNPALFIELRHHIDALADQGDSIGCVVLTGAGRAFSAGHDLGSIAEHERAPHRNFESETIDALEALPQPVIAKIHGYCFTGALELALGCDILIAADTASLADTHGKWGLAPVWGMSVRLPERVGPGRARELMFTSRRLDGPEAASIGLVDRCVPEAELSSVVSALAAEITANSWGTNRIDKQLLADAGRMSREQALNHERNVPHGLPDDMAARMAGNHR